ncbi:hypothetical protein FHR33_005283 [Nonomuraea dietziae]|uniref:Uncharacterized protein n=1 Tax=Nonomuraea dietziae TaxID=65515 RepID=A0A7W5Y992_9ACTN|nr:hypothetical protein [Nonomuraea dietziae]
MCSTALLIERTQSWKAILRQAGMRVVLVHDARHTPRRS